MSENKELDIAEAAMRLLAATTGQKSLVSVYGRGGPGGRLDFERDAAEVAGWAVVAIGRNLRGSMTEKTSDTDDSEWRKWLDQWRREKYSGVRAYVQPEDKEAANESRERESKSTAMLPGFADAVT